jgi:hypothetical protein
MSGGETRHNTQRGKSNVFPYVEPPLTNLSFFIMQLSNNVCTVDFFPEAFIADEGVKRFQKRVTFSNGTKSYSTVTMLTARNEWETRLANGAKVTGYNMDQMPRSEYAPMAVG